MSNLDSTPTRTSARLRGQAPPNQVAARAESPTSAVSALTESTSAQQNRQQRLDDRMNLTLRQLANVASPLVEIGPPPRRPSALEEEQAYDFAAYDDNPGAADSENEAEFSALMERELTTLMFLIPDWVGKEKK